MRKQNPFFFFLLSQDRLGSYNRDYAFYWLLSCTRYYPMVASGPANLIRQARSRSIEHILLNEIQVTRWEKEY